MPLSVSSRGKSRSHTRRVLGWIQIVLTLAVVVFWFFNLRPQGLGGPASYAIVSGKSMLPLYRTGDVVVVHKHSTYHLGDIVAYKVPKGNPAAGLEVIHRLIGGNGTTGWIVKGDNRTAPDVWHPKNGDVVGSAWVHIPSAGFVVRLFHQPLFIAGIAAAIAMATILFRTPKKKPEEEAAPAAAAAAAPPPPEPKPQPQAAPVPTGPAFATRFRGYDREQVLLAVATASAESARLSAELEHVKSDRAELVREGDVRARELAALRAELERVRAEHQDALARVASLKRERETGVGPQSRELQKKLTDALLSAERSATELRFHTQREAEALLAEAQQQARAIAANAELERDRALGDVKAIRALLETVVSALGDAEGLEQARRLFEQDLSPRPAEEPWSAD